MRRLAIAVALACGLSAPARADYQQGLLEYGAGEYELALAEFRPLAQQGDAGAEFMLGVMYFGGAGVPRNEVIAAIFFHQAAVKGEPGAQLAFGSIHIRGVGVFQNLVQAHFWLRLAAQGGPAQLQQQAQILLTGTTSLMTAAEISAAERMARRWRPARAGLVR